MRNQKQTSKKVATLASGLLGKSNSPSVKSVAASDLAQAPLKKKIWLRVKKTK